MKNKTRAWLFHSRPTYFRLCAIVIGLEYHSAGPERMIWHQFSTWFCPWPSFSPLGLDLRLETPNGTFFLPLFIPFALIFTLGSNENPYRVRSMFAFSFSFSPRMGTFPLFLPLFLPLALVFSLRLSFSLQIRKGGDWWTPRIEVLFALISPLISPLSPFFLPLFFPCAPILENEETRMAACFHLFIPLFLPLALVFSLNRSCSPPIRKRRLCEPRSVPLEAYSCPYFCP